jgi:hypothetical protein
MSERIRLLDSSRDSRWAGGAREHCAHDQLASNGEISGGRGHFILRRECRPILLFANTDVSTTKMCLDTSILVKSNMGQREYFIVVLISPSYSCNLKS